VTTTITTPRATDPAARTTSRTWAVAGVGAGLAGIVSVVGSSLSGAVYEDDIAGDAPAIMDRLSVMVPQIMLFHVATMVSALLLVVFSAGLFRQLEQRLGGDSLLPRIASTGLVLVAVTLIMGSGLTTEFVFGVGEPDLLVPETAAVFGHWIGTIPWLWGTIGLTGLAVGVAALRHGAYARWIGVTGLVLGGLTTFLAVSPLQYMAGMTGPLLLTIFSAGLLFSRHEQV